MNNGIKADYSTVTEVFGSKLSREQLKRMCTRYYFAGEYCKGKDVLEVACGVGQGLGYLANSAKRVVGGDCTESLVEAARRYYGDRVQVDVLDAHHLPFPNDSFDVVLLYEAIYYLQDPGQFIRECQRVLRPQGRLIICSANKEWSEFNPSPQSIRYYSARELFALLQASGFTTQLYGDCEVNPDAARQGFVQKLQRLAVKWHLIPRSMKSKELLKRIFFGRLVALDGEIKADMVPYEAPVTLPHENSVTNYKVIFAVGSL